ncbi:MAG TPA: hypothetical protein VFC30_06605 [Solirubrobacteraceae bacterium]|nr:hypothetical protein [Solirubrobacteraceae bacterium]
MKLSFKHKAKALAAAIVEVPRETLKRREISLQQAKRENAIELGKLPQMHDEFERHAAPAECPRDPRWQGGHHFQEWPGPKWTCSQCHGDLTQALCDIIGEPAGWVKAS